LKREKNSNIKGRLMSKKNMRAQDIRKKRKFRINIRVNMKLRNKIDDIKKKKKKKIKF
jgi:hypothetical protein